MLHIVKVYYGKRNFVKLRFFGSSWWGQLYKEKMV